MLDKKEIAVFRRYQYCAPKSTSKIMFCSGSTSRTITLHWRACGTLRCERKLLDEPGTPGLSCQHDKLSLKKKIKFGTQRKRPLRKEVRLGKNKVFKINVVMLKWRWLQKKRLHTHNIADVRYNLWVWQWASCLILWWQDFEPQLEIRLG